MAKTCLFLTLLFGSLVSFFHVCCGANGYDYEPRTFDPQKAQWKFSNEDEDARYYLERPTRDHNVNEHYVLSTDLERPTRDHSVNEHYVLSTDLERPTRDHSVNERYVLSTDLERPTRDHNVNERYVLNTDLDSQRAKFSGPNELNRNLGDKYKYRSSSNNQLVTNGVSLDDNAVYSGEEEENDEDENISENVSYEKAGIASGDRASDATVDSKNDNDASADDDDDGDGDGGNIKNDAAIDDKTDDDNKSSKYHFKDVENTSELQDDGSGDESSGHVPDRKTNHKITRDEDKSGTTINSDNQPSGTSLYNDYGDHFVRNVNTKLNNYNEWEARNDALNATDDGKSIIKTGDSPETIPRTNLGMFNQKVLLTSNASIAQQNYTQQTPASSEDKSFQGNKASKLKNEFPETEQGEGSSFNDLIKKYDRDSSEHSSGQSESGYGQSFKTTDENGDSDLMNDSDNNSDSARINLDMVHQEMLTAPSGSIAQENDTQKVVTSGDNPNEGNQGNQSSSSKDDLLGSKAGEGSSFDDIPIQGSSGIGYSGYEETLPTNDDRKLDNDAESINSEVLMMQARITNPMFNTNTISNVTGNSGYPENAQNISSKIYSQELKRNISHRRNSDKESSLKQEEPDIQAKTANMTRKKESSKMTTQESSNKEASGMIDEASGDDEDDEDISNYGNEEKNDIKHEASGGDQGSNINNSGSEGGGVARVGGISNYGNEEKSGIKHKANRVYQGSDIDNSGNEEGSGVARIGDISEHDNEEENDPEDETSGEDKLDNISNHGDKERSDMVKESNGGDQVTEMNSHGNEKGNSEKDEASTKVNVHDMNSHDNEEDGITIEASSSDNFADTTKHGKRKGSGQTEEVISGDQVNDIDNYSSDETSGITNKGSGSSLVSDHGNKGANEQTEEVTSGDQGNDIGSDETSGQTNEKVVGDQINAIDNSDKQAMIGLTKSANGSSQVLSNHGDIEASGQTKEAISGDQVNDIDNRGNKELITVGQVSGDGEKETSDQTNESISGDQVSDIGNYGSEETSGQRGATISGDEVNDIDNNGNEKTRGLKNKVIGSGQVSDHSNTEASGLTEEAISGDHVNDIDNHGNKELIAVGQVSGDGEKETSSRTDETISGDHNRDIDNNGNEDITGITKEANGEVSNINHQVNEETSGTVNEGTEGSGESEEAISDKSKEFSNNDNTEASGTTNGASGDELVTDVDNHGGHGSTDDASGGNLVDDVDNSGKQEASGQTSDTSGDELVVAIDNHGKEEGNSITNKDGSGGQIIDISNHVHNEGSGSTHETSGGDLVGDVDNHDKDETSGWMHEASGDNYEYEEGSNIVGSGVHHFGDNSHEEEETSGQTNEASGDELVVAIDNHGNEESSGITDKGSSGDQIIDIRNHDHNEGSDSAHETSGSDLVGEVDTHDKEETSGQTNETSGDNHGNEEGSGITNGVGSNGDQVSDITNHEEEETSGQTNEASGAELVVENDNHVNEDASGNKQGSDDQGIDISNYDHKKGSGSTDEAIGSGLIGYIDKHYKKETSGLSNEASERGKEEESGITNGESGSGDKVGDIDSHKEETSGQTNEAVGDELVDNHGDHGSTGETSGGGNLFDDVDSHGKEEASGQTNEASGDELVVDIDNHGKQEGNGITNKDGSGNQIIDISNHDHDEGSGSTHETSGGDLVGDVDNHDKEEASGWIHEASGDNHGHKEESGIRNEESGGCDKVSDNNHEEEETSGQTNEASGDELLVDIDNHGNEDASGIPNKNKQGSSDEVSDISNHDHKEGSGSAHEASGDDLVDNIGNHDKEETSGWIHEASSDNHGHKEGSGITNEESSGVHLVGDNDHEEEETSDQTNEASSDNHGNKEGSGITNEESSGVHLVGDNDHEKEETSDQTNEASSDNYGNKEGSGITKEESSGVHQVNDINNDGNEEISGLTHEANKSVQVIDTTNNYGNKDSNMIDELSGGDQVSDVSNHGYEGSAIAMDTSGNHPVSGINNKTTGDDKISDINDNDNEGTSADMEGSTIEEIGNSNEKDIENEGHRNDENNANEEVHYPKEEISDDIETGTIEKSGNSFKEKDTEHEGHRWNENDKNEEVSNPNRKETSSLGVETSGDIEAGTIEKSGNRNANRIENEGNRNTENDENEGVSSPNKEASGLGVETSGDIEAGTVKKSGNRNTNRIENEGNRNTDNDENEEFSNPNKEASGLGVETSGDIEAGTIKKSGSSEAKDIENEGLRSNENEENKGNKVKNIPFLNQKTYYPERFNGHPNARNANNNLTKHGSSNHTRLMTDERKVSGSGATEVYSGHKSDDDDDNDDDEGRPSEGTDVKGVDEEEKVGEETPGKLSPSRNYPQNGNETDGNKEEEMEPDEESNSGHKIESGTENISSGRTAKNGSKGPGTETGNDFKFERLYNGSGRNSSKSVSYEGKSSKNASKMEGSSKKEGSNVTNSVNVISHEGTGNGNFSSLGKSTAEIKNGTKTNDGSILIVTPEKSKNDSKLQSFSKPSTSYRFLQRTNQSTNATHNDTGRATDYRWKHKENNKTKHVYELWTIERKQNEPQPSRNKATNESFSMPKGLLNNRTSPNVTSHQNNSNLGNNNKVNSSLTGKANASETSKMKEAEEKIFRNDHEKTQDHKLRKMLRKKPLIPIKHDENRKVIKMATQSRFRTDNSTELHGTKGKASKEKKPLRTSSQPENDISNRKVSQEETPEKINATKENAATNEKIDISFLGKKIKTNHESQKEKNQTSLSSSKIKGSSLNEERYPSPGKVKIRPPSASEHPKQPKSNRLDLTKPASNGRIRKKFSSRKQMNKPKPKLKMMLEKDSPFGLKSKKGKNSTSETVEKAQQVKPRLKDPHYDTRKRIYSFLKALKALARARALAKEKGEPNQERDKNATSTSQGARIHLTRIKMPRKDGKKSKHQWKLQNTNLSKELLKSDGRHASAKAHNLTKNATLTIVSQNKTNSKEKDRGSKKLSDEKKQDLKAKGSSKEAGVKGTEEAKQGESEPSNPQKSGQSQSPTAGQKSPSPTPQGSNPSAAGQKNSSPALQGNKSPSAGQKNSNPPPQGNSPHPASPANQAAVPNNIQSNANPSQMTSASTSASYPYKAQSNQNMQQPMSASFSYQTRPMGAASMGPASKVSSKQQTGYNPIIIFMDRPGIAGNNQGSTGYQPSSTGYTQASNQPVYTGYTQPSNQPVYAGYTQASSQPVNAGYSQASAGYNMASPGYTEGYADYNQGSTWNNQASTGYSQASTGYSQQTAGYSQPSGYNYQDSSPGTSFESTDPSNTMYIYNTYEIVPSSNSDASSMTNMEDLPMTMEAGDTGSMNPQSGSMSELQSASQPENGNSPAQGSIPSHKVETEVNKSAKPESENADMMQDKVKGRLEQPSSESPGTGIQNKGTAKGSNTLSISIKPESSSEDMVQDKVKGKLGSTSRVPETATQNQDNPKEPSAPLISVGPESVNADKNQGKANQSASKAPETAAQMEDNAKGANVASAAKIQNIFDVRSSRKNPFDIKNLMQLSEENIEDVLKAVDQMAKRKGLKLPPLTPDVVDESSLVHDTRIVPSALADYLYSSRNAQDQRSVPAGQLQTSPYTTTENNYLRKDPNREDELFDPNGNTYYSPRDYQIYLTSNQGQQPKDSIVQGLFSQYPESSQTGQNSNRNVDGDWQEADLAENSDDHIFFKDPVKSKPGNKVKYQSPNSIANYENNKPPQLNVKWFPNGVVNENTDGKILSNLKSGFVSKNTASENPQTPFTSKQHAKQNFFLAPQKIKPVQDDKDLVPVELKVFNEENNLRPQNPLPASSFPTINVNDKYLRLLKNPYGMEYPGIDDGKMGSLNGNGAQTADMSYPDETSFSKEQQEIKETYSNGKWSSLLKITPSLHKKAKVKSKVHGSGETKKTSSNLEKFFKEEPKHHFKALDALQSSFDDPSKKQNGDSYFSAASLQKLLEDTDEGIEQKIVSLTGKTRENVWIVQPTISSAMKYAMDVNDAIQATPRSTPTNGPTYRHYKERLGFYGNIDDDTKKKCAAIGKTTFQDSKCPHGWVPHVEFCYGFFDYPKTHWTAFPPKCAIHNAVLAMPKTEEELGFITAHLRDRGTLDVPYHIGLNKRKETWNWVDDNPFSMDSNFNDLDVGATGDLNCGMIENGHIKASKCDKARSFVCEIKRGMEAVRILAFGDSLTRGYYGGGKDYHPYTEKLEYLLNTDSHKCFVVDNQGKDKEMAADMTKRLDQYLRKASTWYKWVIILGGTNDIVHDTRPPTEANYDRIVHDVIMAHQTAHKHGFNSIVVTIPEIDCEHSSKPQCRKIHKERLYVNQRLRHYARETSAAILSDLAGLLPRSSLETEKRMFYWEQGLHMKPQGYDRMAEIIYEDILRNI